LKGKMMNSLTKQQCKWPDPARPGWPLHPERPGKHWLRSPDGMFCFSVWFVTDNPNESFWERGPGWSSPAAIARKGWTYLGPCLIPDEVAAIKARSVKLAGIVGTLKAERDQLIGVLQIAIEKSGDLEPRPAWVDGACNLLNRGFLKVDRAALKDEPFP
jgi:hypothetical protein